MNIFGLDIGSNSIKIAQVSREGNKFRLVAAGITPTPQPGLKSELEEDLVSVATAIKKLWQDVRISSKDVVIALPEDKIFTRVVELPPMSENELAQAIPWEAEQFVPMPLSEVNLDWQIIFQGSKPGKVQEKTKVFIVAAPISLIDKYLKVLEMGGFKVAAIETEMIAAVRALVPKELPLVLLVNLGAKSCDLAVVQNGYLALTRSIPSAGEALTRAIATALSLDPLQAEEYKIAYGLAEDQFEGKIKNALSPVLEEMVSEIRKMILSWREKENENISNIILAGGTASLPAIGKFLTEKLETEIQIADPFSRMILDQNQIAGLKDKSALFAVALGLAQKEV